MTVIFFAGPRLDHGDADVISSTESDYLDRRDAPPPVVVRGYSVSGHLISTIRAGVRIKTAAAAAAADLGEYGADILSEQNYWLIPARNEQGVVVTGFTLKTTYSPTTEHHPPFSFRPSAALPAPNGHLFLLGAPIGYQTLESWNWYPPGWFIDFMRVYRRNGDRVDFPELHGGQIHDIQFNGSGDIFVAGAEVGANQDSFRKYNSAGTLQWSVSFSAYDRPEDPIRTVANRRRHSTNIQIGDGGEIYIVGAWVYDYTVSPGIVEIVVDRYYLARVSSSGAIVWYRLFIPVGSAKKVSRDIVSFKALSDRLVLFFYGYRPVLIANGKTTGSYSSSDWLYLGYPVQPNGPIFDLDGEFIGHVFPYGTESQVFTLCAMRYADEKLYVNSARYSYSDGAWQYRRHVFYKDLTLISETVVPYSDISPIFAVSELQDEYYGYRRLTQYGPGTLSGDPSSLIDCADHLFARDNTGAALWSGLSATGALGVNQYGKLWRDYGGSRSNEPFYSIPAGSTQLEFQTFHDTLVRYTTAHGALASADYLGVSSEIDFWLPASCIMIAYDSPTPALALPVFLKRPDLSGPRTTLPLGLALRFGLAAPFLRREYVGPLAAQIHRLTLGNLEIPFSHLSARKTAFETTVSAICPAASEPLVAAILARDTDTFTIWRGVRFPDGAEQLEPLLSGTLAGIRYDRGARSGSITLDLRQEPAATPARIRSLAAVSRRDARSWSSPLPDVFLNPGDTAVVGALSFTVGSVDYLISPTDARMTVGNAE